MSSSATIQFEIEESMCDGPRKWSVVDREPCASLPYVGVTERA